MMQFSVLGSGSKGNSVLIREGATAILIDAGFSAREISRRLAAVNVDVAELSAILVTHEHSDHIRGVAVLSRQGRLPVFANAATFRAAGDRLADLDSCREFATGSSFVFQDLQIHPFSVSHDAADPVGFVIKNGSCTLGYCTDTGKISQLMLHRLTGCHGLILESNHDLEMLQNGSYPPFLKQRVRSNLGHLANGDTASMIQKLVHDSLQHVVLAHISEKNNRPEIACETVRRVLPANHRISVVTASQDQAGPLVTLGRP